MARILIIVRQGDDITKKKLGETAESSSRACLEMEQELLSRGEGVSSDSYFCPGAVVRVCGWLRNTEDESAKDEG